MELQDLKSAKKIRKNYQEKIEEKPSIVSRLFFAWMHPLLYSEKVCLENEDTIPLKESEKVCNEKLTDALRTRTLFFGIIYVNFKTLSTIFFLGIFTLLLDFKNPVYMSLLLEYLNSNDKSLEYGVFLAGTFMLLTLTYPFVESHRIFQARLLEIRVRNSLYNVIYNKALHTAALPEGLGINLLQIDVDLIKEFFGYLVFLLNIPLQIILSSYMIYQQVGSAVIIAFFTVILAMVGNGIFSSTCKNTNEALMKIRDSRIDQSSQFLNSIKIIKANNLQDFFTKKIKKIRKLELQKEKFLNTLWSINNFCFWVLPNITFTLVILWYTMGMGKEISSQKVFVTFTTISHLCFPLLVIPNIVTHMTRVVVSQKRVQEALNAKNWVKPVDSSRISLENCRFGYTSEAVLNNITLNIAPHEFTAIIGPVGSGKSALLLSILGETNLISGDFSTTTDISYAPSLEPIIISASLRENILFGKDFREKWYWEVVSACGLIEDFQEFSSADFTEIGEKGINLSGGQKARICLARAVYADSKVILMDDPLSSVDPQVGDWIFQKCFKELLEGKTIVMATHRTEYLNRVDRVVQMENGEISKIFHYDYAENQEIKKENIRNIEKVVGEKIKLVEDEDRFVGQVDRSVYMVYMKWAGGCGLILIGGISVLVWICLSMLADITLKNWSNNSEHPENYLTDYIVFTICRSIFVLFRFLLFGSLIAIRASRTSHTELLSSLSSAPVNLFYDITPTGRILNRLSKDINTIDENVSKSWSSFMVSICLCTSSITMGLLYFPYLILLVPLIIFPTNYIRKIYMKNSRELTRLESISRSPIISHFTESLNGVVHVRVFGQIANFIKKNQEFIDRNTRVNLSLNGCRHWMRLYLELVSALLVISLFWIAVAFRDQVSSAVVGLCMAYLFPLPNEINALIVNGTDMENAMVSVERVKSLTETPSEQSIVTLADQKFPEWPQTTCIKFCKVHMKYRPNTETVLKGVSFEVPTGSHIGIAGRTGSGKSSIFLSLLRIVELEKGLITIGDVNIALLGLHKIRENIMLIPQNPLIFNGTVKENLDPLGLISSKKASKVLEKVHLKFGLDFEITGSNISVGERQLLSLARALTTSKKIILLDEATAGVDPDTDCKIQRILASQFKNTTVLTIAHRLNTIKNSDFILILESGKVSNFQRPTELHSTLSSFPEFFT